MPHMKERYSTANIRCPYCSETYTVPSNATITLYSESNDNYGIHYNNALVEVNCPHCNADFLAELTIIPYLDNFIQSKYYQLFNIFSLLYQFGGVRLTPVEVSDHYTTSSCFYVTNMRSGITSTFPDQLSTILQRRRSVIVRNILFTYLSHVYNDVAPFKKQSRMKQIREYMSSIILQSYEDETISNYNRIVGDVVVPEHNSPYFKKTPYHETLYSFILEPFNTLLTNTILSSSLTEKCRQNYSAKVTLDKLN